MAASKPAATPKADVGSAAPSVQSSSRYSSGPIHRVARVALACARQGSSENSTPHAGRMAALASAPPCKEKRRACGSTASHSVFATVGARRAAGSLPASSTIDACSARVVENRRGDLDFKVAAGHRHIQRLAQFGTPAGHHRQRDGMTERAARIR